MFGLTVSIYPIRSISLTKLLVLKNIQYPRCDMKSWIQERDRLIAETMAFAKEIAASTPAPVKAQIATAPTDQVQEAGQPIQVEPEQAEAPPKPIDRRTPLARMDERAEIARRIASFKAHQARFSEDREKFFRSVMTKIENQGRSANLRKD
jgi:hypothetical protein